MKHRTNGWPSVRGSLDHGAGAFDPGARDPATVGFRSMRKFWKSLRFWKTDSSARKGRSVPVGDLKVPVGETGWGSKAPRTKAHEGDLKVSVGELGWGLRAPKTKR